MTIVGLILLKKKKKEKKYPCLSEVIDSSKSVCVSKRYRIYGSMLATGVVCQEFRPVGSVRGPSGGHLRMRVSPKWGLRRFGRVGKTVII